MSRGDCFQAAFGLQRDDDTLILCHGLAIGTGTENGGRRFWHAWAERTQTFDVPGYPHPVEVVTCLDYANGRSIQLPAQMYYRIGQIEPGLTYRYTRHEAAVEAVRTLHYGPWVADPEGVEVVR